MNLRCILCRVVAGALAFMITTSAHANHKQVPRITLDIDETRLIRLDTPINQFTSDYFVEEIHRLDDGKKPIMVMISSPGGEILSGIEMIKAVQDAKSPVTCVVDRYAASMAGFLAVACPKLIMHKFGILMFHEYANQIKGSRKEIMSQLQLSEALFNALMNEMSRKSGIPRKMLDKLVAKDWWLNADMAEHAHLVSAVVDHYNITVKASAVNQFVERIFRNFTPARKENE